MNSRNLVGFIVLFLVYFLLQVVILKDIVLFGSAFCFIYVGFLLLLPLNLGRLFPLVIGFTMGVLVDLFYDSIGVHAAASVFLMYLRNIWINTLTPRAGYEINKTVSPSTMGLGWFTSYSLPLLLLHHLLLFFIEAGSFSLFNYTLLKIISSAVFTYVIILIAHYLARSPRRQRVYE